MLICPIYSGSGLGNQLHNIITTKCLALDHGYDFVVAFPEQFKGTFFKNLELPEVKGLEVAVEGQTPTKLPAGMSYYHETSSDYDDFVLNIPDNYVLHGNLQGEEYFKKYKKQIRHWLAVEPLDMPDNLCICNFRGGEYSGVPDFFLPQSYWDNAMTNMLKINPQMEFEIHTDDPITAKRFFPDFECIHDMEFNWRSIRFAKYIILSNSSFGWFPAWLGNAKLIIAPEHWGRHNRGYWYLQQNQTEKFTYQNREGVLL